MAKSATQQRVRYVHLTVFLIVFGLWVIVPPAALGQGASATVNGIVSDPSSAAVPNAQVELKNVNTGVVRSTSTNSTGNYLFLDVTPGEYTMRAVATGFSP